MDVLFTTSLLTTLDLVNSSNVNLLSLEDRLGPKRQDLYKVIPVTVIYVGIFFTGIVGNVCTCIVIARNRYMHTTTNFCLFNLAVSDLLVLILGLPQETYSFWSAYPWIFGETFCVVRTMAAETSTYASILTITAFTVERYVAICHPVKARAVAGLHRAAKIIILIWVISAVCSIPIVVQYGVVYLKDKDGVVIQGSATCNIQPDRYLAHAFEASTFLFFIAPVTVISVLYMLIGLAIRKSTMTRKGSDASTGSGRTGNDLRAQQHARARLAVIKMLVAVVVAFFICWAPFHTQRLLTIYSVPSPMTTAILFYVSGIFYYVSAVINPILYSIMSIKFRKAFRNTICSMRCGSIGRSNRSEAGGRRSAAVRTAYKFNGVRSAVAGTRGKLCPAGVGGGGGSGERHLPADGPEAPANSLDQSYSSAAGQPLSRGHMGREEQFNARVCSGGSSISKGNINICLNTTAWMGNSELKSSGCCVRLDHNGTMITPTKQDDRLCSCHRHQFRNQYYNCSSIWRNEASWTNADRIDWNCCDQLQPLKNDARDDWRRHRCGQAIWSLDRTTV